MRAIKIMAAAVCCCAVLSACNKEAPEQAETSETAAPSVETTTAHSEAETEITEKMTEAVTTAADDIPQVHIDDKLIYPTLEWYDENGSLHTEEGAYGAADAILEKLAESGVLWEGLYALDWSAEIVDDGVIETKGGLKEAYHIEGTLDISLPFTDLLNQCDEERQRMILDTVARSFEQSYGTDAVRILCDGKPVSTDLVDYDAVFAEKVSSFIVTDFGEEGEAAYEEAE